MNAVELKTDFNQALDLFKQISADCKLVVLGHIYGHLGRAIATPAPAAVFSQVVNNLLRHLQQVRREDRVEALKDILNGADTRFGREYAVLTINMRLAFWYRLAQKMEPALSGVPCSRDRFDPTQDLLYRMDGMDLNQQMHFLRQVLGSEDRY